MRTPAIRDIIIIHLGSGAYMMHDHWTTRCYILSINSLCTHIFRAKPNPTSLTYFSITPKERQKIFHWWHKVIIISQPNTARTSEETNSPSAHPSSRQHILYIMIVCYFCVLVLVYVTSLAQRRHGIISHLRHAHFAWRAWVNCVVGMGLGLRAYIVVCT